MVREFLFVLWNWHKVLCLPTLTACQELAHGASLEQVRSCDVDGLSVDWRVAQVTSKCVK